MCKVNVLTCDVYGTLEYGFKIENYFLLTWPWLLMYTNLNYSFICYFCKEKKKYVFAEVLSCQSQTKLGPEIASVTFAEDTQI
jgi:hypothetical protein